MYPRRMMIVGVIMMLVAIGILAFTLVIAGEEEDAVKKAARFDGDAAGAVQGKLIIVEGRVSAKNRMLLRDFVDAAKEYQADKGSWTILESYRQPVLADLARGGIILNSGNVCTRAKGNNVLKTDERTASGRKIRYTGLKRGDPITAVGTLNSSAQAALEVAYWYSGSVADYENYLASSRKGAYIFFAVIAALGAGFILLGWKNR